MSNTSFSTPSHTVYRIRNWQQLLGPQKGKSRGGFLGRLSLIALSPCTGMNTLVRKRLFNLPQGVASYSVWLLLVQIAAQTSIPGCFVDEETPLTAEDLSLLTDVPLGEMQVALDNLSRPEIRLIERVALDIVLKESAALNPNDATRPTAPAAEPRPSTTNAISLPFGPDAPDAVAPPERQFASPTPADISLSDAVRDVHSSALTASGAESSAVSASSTVADDIALADQQLTKLMGVFNQVQQMKQQVDALSGGPLQSHLQTRKSKRRRNELAR